MSNPLPSIPGGLVSKILEDNSKEIKNKLSNFISDKWEKCKIDFEIVYKDYYDTAYKKYNKIKTILCPQEPMNLYDFFVTPNLAKNTNRSPDYIPLNSVKNVTELSNFILIKGIGGIGKTTIMKHFFLNAIENELYIPVFIELRTVNKLNNNYLIEDLVFNELSIKGSSLKKNFLDYALKTGSFLFLFDGFDEINSNSTRYFIQKLDEFCDKYSHNHYIITSREVSDFFEFQRFSILNSCPFTKLQAIDYIKKVPYEKEVKERFILNLDMYLFYRYESFASNPLLLSIMLLTYDGYAYIPYKLHLFYSQAFDTMFYKHDSTKSGFIREIRSKLDIESFKKIFAAFCFYTYVIKKIDFTKNELVKILEHVKESNSCYRFNIENYIYDLANAVCVITKDGSTYTFSHRSFQEYFCALYIIDRPDDIFKKICYKLIEKDPFAASYEMVYKFIREICEERFNHNILIPIIDETFQKHKDNIDLFLLKRFFLDYTLDYNNGGTSMSFTRNNDLLYFVQDFCFSDCLFCGDDYSEYEEKLEAYVTKTFKSEDGRYKFSAEEIIADPVLYDLFLNGVYEGRKAKFLKTYKDYLIKRSNNSGVLPKMDELLL